MGFLSKENGPCEEMSIIMEEVSKLVTEAQCVNLELVNTEKEVLNEVEIKFNEVIVTDHYMAYGVNNYKITFSKALFSLETSSLARLITEASSPSLSLIARAFDLPGTPISRR